MSKFIINAFADEADDMITGQIAALKRNELDGLEIRGVDGDNIGDVSIEKAKEVLKQLEDNGLNVWSIGSRIGKIKIEDDFAPHLDELKRTLEIANVMKAKYIRMFSFYMPEGENPDGYRDEVMERLEKMVEVAKGSGVKLCHENEKGIYGDNAQRCLDIYKNINELGGIFDPANFVQCGQDTLQAWDMLSDYIEYMHIKDAEAGGDIVPAGQGIGNIKEILVKYAVKGGKAITLEPHLAEFGGLAGLEREGEKSVVGKVKYESKDAAFDVGVAALKEII